MERTLEEIDLTPEEIERVWIDEAARRYQQLLEGTATSIRSDEVFVRLEERGHLSSRSCDSPQ